MPKNLFKIFENISFLHIPKFSTHACYYYIMDIPPVPNQPTSFKFPQRSFGKANHVTISFQAPWFSTRTWLLYVSKIVSKCIKIISTYIPYERGNTPSRALPLLVPSALVIHGRTTLQKPTTALFLHLV